MKKFFAAVATLFVVLALVYFKPWGKGSSHTLNTLFDADQRAENFRTMEALLESIRIPASRTPYTYAQALEPLMPSYAFDGQTVTLDDFLTRTETTGLLVIRDGIIVTEEYRNGADKTSRLTSWSVAKSFISTLIGIAYEEGHIKSLQDTAETYVPLLKGTAYGRTTIENLLQMSSGIDFLESYEAVDVATLSQMTDVQLAIYRATVLGGSMDKILAAYDRLEPQGQRFYYRSSDTHILSMVVRGATGRRIEDYIAEKLWQPLGMEDDAVWTIDGHGVPIGFCCLNMRLRDYAKLGSLFLAHGTWNGTEILSRDWVRQATRPSKPYLEPGIASQERGYQYQWWVPPSYDGEFFATGIWGQYIWVSEKQNIVIVKTSTDPDFRANTRETIQFFRALGDHYSAATPKGTLESDTDIDTTGNNLP